MKLDTRIDGDAKHARISDIMRSTVSPSADATWHPFIDRAPRGKGWQGKAKGEEQRRKEEEKGEKRNKVKSGI